MELKLKPLGLPSDNERPFVIAGLALQNQKNR